MPNLVAISQATAKINRVNFATEVYWCKYVNGMKNSAEKWEHLRNVLSDIGHSKSSIKIRN